MKFWDASAVVPLLVRQARTEEMLDLLERDPAVIVWWGTRVECISAMARLEREGRLNPEALQSAERRLRELLGTWNEVLPGEHCRRMAERMLKVHPLRAADSLQLAAAILAVDHEPDRLEFVCLDEKLGQAAIKEGFRLTVRA
jgi:uncharacterized protein